MPIKPYTLHRKNHPNTSKVSCPYSKAGDLQKVQHRQLRKFMNVDIMQ